MKLSSRFLFFSCIFLFQLSDVLAISSAAASLQGNSIDFRDDSSGSSLIAREERRSRSSSARSSSRSSGQNRSSRSSGTRTQQRSSSGARQGTSSRSSSSRQRADQPNNTFRSRSGADRIRQGAGSEGSNGHIPGTHDPRNNGNSNSRLRNSASGNPRSLEGSRYRSNRSVRSRNSSTSRTRIRRSSRSVNRINNVSINRSIRVNRVNVYRGGWGRRRGWIAARPWPYRWYGGWRPGVYVYPGWNWWYTYAPLWGIATLTSVAVIQSSVDQAIENNTDAISVNDSEFQIYYSSVKPLDEDNIEFSFEYEGSFYTATANCRSGLLNDETPSAAEEAELLHYACSIAFSDFDSNNSASLPAHFHPIPPVRMPDFFMHNI